MPDEASVWPKPKLFKNMENLLISNHVEVAKVKLELAARLVKEAQQHVRNGYKKGQMGKAMANDVDQQLADIVQNVSAINNNFL